MRVLLLFRGAPGVGKSTYINEHGLHDYTLCADELRLLCQSPKLDTHGKINIGADNEARVWNTLFEILEIRMQNGEFTVIDATNSKAIEINRYKALAKQYRYRIYIIDMTDVPIEECKRRNAGREELKRVPEAVIDKMYARFATQKIPSGIKVLKPDELDSIWYRPIDFSGYKKIVHIGDIHGCYTVLKEYLGEDLEDDVMYIFVGDYLDRGIENADVIRFLLKIYERKNVLLLTGNHEQWIYNYAYDKQSKSREFELVTRPQLDEAEFDKNELKRLYSKFAQCALYHFHEKEVLVCHGGISALPINLTLVASQQLIKGVGNYSDYEDVAEAWMQTTEANQYQVFGHRNTKASDIQLRDRVFNLEGRVEFGGCLRVVELDHEGWHPIEIKNTVFRPQKEFEERKDINSNDVASTVLEMRKSKYIQEKKFDNGISSFNFTKEAFVKGVWDKMTTHARGLFIDTNKMKVACRSYSKFFFINSRESISLAEYKERVKFPIIGYLKYNGFLGILSYDEYANDFRFCSKSVVGGEYAGWFEEIFYKVTTEENRQNILDYLRQENCSFIFEVIDPRRDPHIIEYDKEDVVLLDIIKNDLNFQKLKYSEMVSVAHDFGLTHKREICSFSDWDQFCSWYEDAQKPGYTLNGRNVEGFVIEDAEGFMFKLKTDYYCLWKKMRMVKDIVFRKGYIDKTGMLTGELDNLFYGFVKKMYEDTEPEKRGDLLKLDIITLRKMFYKDKENK